MKDGKPLCISPDTKGLAFLKSQRNLRLLEGNSGPQAHAALYRQSLTGHILKVRVCNIPDIHVGKWGYLERLLTCVQFEHKLEKYYSARHCS